MSGEEAIKVLKGILVIFTEKVKELEKMIILRKDTKYLILLRDAVSGPDLQLYNKVFGTIKESNQLFLIIGQLSIHPDNVISAYKTNTIQPSVGLQVLLTDKIIGDLQ